ERLRERHEVGLHAELLRGEERPGAPYARLDLVEREQCAELVRKRRGCGDEAGIERDDSALAEHRLEQNEADVVARCLVQRGRVVRRREARRAERLERASLRRLAGDGKGAESASVERALEREHAGLAGRLARVPA